MSILDLVTNAASGGIVGVLGSGISKAFNIVDAYQTERMEKLKNAQELALFELQMKLKTAEDAITAEVTKDTNSVELMKASYDSATALDTANGSARITDVLRLVRPTITFMMIIATGVIWATSKDSMIDKQIVDTVLFCTSSCILWWYGSRDIAKGK